MNRAVATLTDDQQILDYVLPALRSSSNVVGVLASGATARPAGLTEPFSTLHSERAGPFHGGRRLAGFALQI